ncbi:MAG: electron transfer flavoprotein subunit beta/FixA family protein [Bacteroidaceae bacterium]|nr:electron transfer flavoprotein subunit beta/FixA family protein [Bacteroidaceae bacterium]
MNLNIIVLAKQVPDTRCVSQGTMNADGTINRAALPVIINPDDMKALEQALRLKEAHPGSTIRVLTMGPSRAADVVRESLFRGADGGYLLSDAAFAGADTLATSYVLATAIGKMGKCDIVLCGRQAIDGETAQVGSQVAERLGMPQITYAEKILSVNDGQITVKRRIDDGVEIVEAPLPLVVTVDGSAVPCRPRNAKWLMSYKHADIEMWSATDIDADLAQCGLAGSPTRVKAVESVVLKAKEARVMGSSDEEIEELMKSLP